MFGIRFIKAPPTAYVLHYKNGLVRREGQGLSFFYYAPTSSIVLVPVSSTDLPFVFNEVTNDFQSVTVQGQIAYRVVDPKTLSSLMDFSLAPTGKYSYASDDPAKLRERLIHVAQVLTGAVVARMNLREALASPDAIAREVLDKLRHADAVTMLGLEILGLDVLALRPTPEMSKALEAAAREELLRTSDEAIYARRNAAVEQERIIRENELSTEIAVEAKKRQIRETQIAADIAVESQRETLIERKSANDRKEADAKAYALDTTLRPVRDLDWRTLVAIAQGGSDPKLMIGMAFRELAENAQKIGELNITPDLLKSLMTSSRRG
jgi:regulator of protease activity HflC (stomatin/prohibitin superfamily)